MALTSNGVMLSPDAEAVEVGSDRPFYLDGEGGWMLLSGRLDVFVVSRDGDRVGNRRHLMRLEAEQLILESGVALPGPRQALLAVGSPGTRLARIERAELRAAARDPVRAPILRSMIEGWVVALCAGSTTEVAPGECLDAGPGTEIPEGTTSVRPIGPVCWVRHDLGHSLLLGRDGLVVNGAERVPLARSAWLRLEEGSRLQIVETDAIIGTEDLWKGLARLSQLLLQLAGQSAAEAAEAERSRLRVKAATSRTVLVGACANLANTLDSARRTRPRMRRRGAADRDGVTAEEALLASCRLVGEALDLTIRPPPGPPSREALAAIARASRFRTRRVLLRDDWWCEDGGPFLGWLEEGERAVAILPVGGHGYLLHDPSTGTVEPVTGAVAERLKGTAYSFYQPFPDRALRMMDVVRFGLRGSGRDIWTVLLMGTFAGLLSLLTPIATGMVFNDIIPSADRSMLTQLTIILVVLAAGAAMFNVTSAIALVRLEGRMGGNTQAAVWDRLLCLPMTFFRPYTAGNLANRAMGIDQIRQVLSGAAVTALLGGLFSLFHFGLLFYYSAVLAWWATGLIALAVACAATASWLQIRPQRAVAEIQSRLAGSVLQFLSSVSKLRVSAAEPQAFAIWAGGFSQQRRLQYQVRGISNGLASFQAGYPLLAYLVIYAVAQPRMIPGPAMTLRTGDFLAFITSFGTCMTGMLAAATAVLGMLRVIPLYEQAVPILDALPEVDAAKADPGVLKGDIEIQHLVFRYQADGPQVLRDVTLRIRPGEFVAFVGPSGSGKSTILRLLLGFETPESGAVYYDGQEMIGLDAQAVRRQIGVVLQSGRLMSGDIFTNIAGSSVATLDDAWEAARMAGFDADIKAMPMGMHTVVSEGGGTLSGGQRQRLMIARAIVQRPRILFFDEATSALDNRTQSIVSESLEHLQATRVVIAHRLSTIVNADRIFVVNAGRIVQSGSYTELMAEPGPFAELAERQLA